MKLTFCRGPFEKGQWHALDADTLHHLKHVYRIRHKCALQVFDGSGVVAEALFQDDGVLIQSVNTHTPAKKLTIFQGMCKAKVLDLIIEKTTELGVFRVVFFPAEHSEKFQLSELELQRLQKKAKEACQQSGNPFLPQISVEKTFPSVPVGAVFADMGGNEGVVSSSEIFIGPEGGWSSDERQLFLEHGAHSVSLGPYVLRAETAAIVAAARIYG